LATYSDIFKHFIATNTTEWRTDTDDLWFKTRSDLCSRVEVSKLVLGDVTSEYIKTAKKTGRWYLQDTYTRILEHWIDVLSWLNSKITFLDTVHKNGSELKDVNTS
jgi:hypothetical protein